EGRRGAGLRGHPRHPAPADHDAEDPRRARAGDDAQGAGEGAGVTRASDENGCAPADEPVDELVSGLGRLRDVEPPPSLVAGVMRRIAEPPPPGLWSWL